MDLKLLRIIGTLIFIIILFSNNQYTSQLSLKKEGFFKTFVVLILRCRKIEKD